MFALFALLLDSASAAEPSVRTNSAGETVARIVLSADPIAVRAALADATSATELTPEVEQVLAHASGPCHRISVVTRGPWAPLRYEGLRCPTDQGWKTELVSSEDFRVLHVEWNVLPADTGTTVEYKVRAELLQPLPPSWVRRGLERSARATVDRLCQRLASTLSGG